MTIASLFTRSSTMRLRDEYLPRIRAAVAILDHDDLWWRPKDYTNSVGNLLVHLAGNVRQWIVSGVGGAPDERDRAQEFAQPDEDLEGESKQTLLEDLTATVEEAIAVIDSLDEEGLQREYAIQGGRTTGLEAVYHAVEHFGWHVGQIVFITKLKSAQGAQLRFYDDREINRLRNG